MKKVAYKQTIEHINQEFNIPKNYKIGKVSDICKSYYNPDLPKTNNLEEFYKRAPRYSFTVYLRGSITLPCHTFLFNTEQSAKNMHKKYLARYIDQELEKYRKRVNSGKKLSISEIDKCKEIQALLPED